MTDLTKAEKLKKIMHDLKLEYLKSFPQKIERLRVLTASENWVELSEEYHKLKGTGKTYGFPDVSRVSEKFEKLAKDNAFQNQDFFKNAISLFERLRAGYEKDKPITLEDDPFGNTVLQIPVPK